LSDNEVNHIYQAEMYINDSLVETAKLPTDFTTRRFYLFWKYQLPKDTHKVTIKIKNPVDDAHISLESIVVYDDKPLLKIHET